MAELPGTHPVVAMLAGLAFDPHLACDPGAELVGDLGFDSLDFLQLHVDLEERLGIEISEDEAEAWQRVSDVVAFHDAHLQGFAQDEAGR
jgi:acyl carrier protein